jgi:acyl carrier protein phosphodiesterase
MNWLAHLFLSRPNIEDRLGNVLADLVKGEDKRNLNCCFDRGIKCHLLVDSFTDKHFSFKHSKRMIIVQHRRYAGILIDIYYDHLLARNWSNYSTITLSVFKQDIYQSFTQNIDKIPEKASLTLQKMICEDWLGSYYYLSGIEKALIRIKKRLSTKYSDDFIVNQAIKQLENQYDFFNKDFNILFPELITYIS